MTLDQFNQLRPKAQLAYAYHEGTFLATRRRGERESVDLYELPGRFFVELTYDAETNLFVALRSFSSSTELENYAGSVKLPDWLSGE